VTGFELTGNARFLFIGVVDRAAEQRILFMEGGMVVAATTYRFVVCGIRIPGIEAIGFQNLIRENSVFIETTGRICRIRLFSRGVCCRNDML
jgi:hypothetical protein